VAWPFVSGAASATLAVTKSVTKGNLLVVFHATGGGGAFTPTVSDNGATPNSWAPVPNSPLNDATNNDTMAVWTAVAKVTGSITVTVANSGASFNGVALGEWTPPAAAPIVEAFAKTVNGAGSIVADAVLSGSVTTVADGDLIVSFILDAATLPAVTEFNAGTNPNVFTKRATLSNDPGGGAAITWAVEDFVQTTHAAINPTWTEIASANYDSFTLAFKARAAGITGHMQSAATAANGAGTTRVAVFANNPKPGNLIAVGVEFFLAAGTTTFTVADSAGNNYTVTPNSPSALDTQASGQSGQAYLLVAPANADKTITVTFGVDLGAGGGAYIWTEEFSYEGTAAFDSDAGAHGLSINPVLPNIGSASNQLLHFNSSFNGTPTAVNSPWTLGTLILGEVNGYVMSSSGASIAVSYQASGGTTSWSNMAQAISFSAAATGAGYSLGGGPLQGALANIVEKQIIEEGPRNAVVKLTGVLTVADENKTSIISFADFINNDKGALKGFRVDTILYSIGQRLTILLSWNSQIPQQIVTLVRSGKIDATDKGGILPEFTRSGYDGSINLVTKGFPPGGAPQNFMLLLRLVKLYK